MAEKRRMHSKRGKKKFTWKKRKVEDDILVKSSAFETQTDSDFILWNEGRRIVELGYLAEQLSCCKKCKKSTLNLSDCLAEVRYGFGSVLKIKCQQCKTVNCVYTGKQHRDENKENKGFGIWDINTKSALAMIHTGMGPEQVGYFFSTMNVPSITVKALKKREREIGSTIEKKAADTCKQGIDEEIRINRTSTEEIHENLTSYMQPSTSTCTVVNSPENDGDIERLLSVSFDGAWQKRGSGKCYNSKTGHATMIGENTGKCVDFGVKSTDCRKCLFTGKQSDHDCRKNYAGSARSMESAIAVDLVSNLMEMGYRVKSITMDEDSTTISRLHKSVDPNIVKQSDKNHIKKNLSNSLYEIKKGHKELSTSIISYFVRCASYAISQNQGHSEELNQSLLAIVPHAYGDHDSCKSEWCGFLRNPETYKHNGLPGGFDMSGEQLRDDLLKLFKRFADRSDRLIHIGTSQANESLNHIIATKAPKAKHFGGSESLNFRVAAGVAQLNCGRKYIVDVNENHGLSPGKVTITKTIKIDEKAKRDAENKKLPAMKRKRKNKKSDSFVNTVTKETKEGITYQSQVTMGPDGDHADIETIPDPSDLELPKTVVIDNNEELSVVVFDIETTGFGYDSEIVQLSAVCDKGEFDKYIIPTKPIHPKATEVTHLFSTGTRLYYKGQQLKTEPKENVFNSFIDWLPKNALLVAHNCKQFDAKILVSQMQPLASTFLENLKDHMLGFSDTLPLFRVKFPKRKSYSQSSLAKDILKTTYNAHNALDDVKILKQLIEVDITKEQLIENSFEVNEIERQLQMFNAKKHLLVSYNGVIREKVMSKALCDRAAGSGLSFEHIKSSFRRAGQDGVRSIFAEKTSNGKPRISNQKKIINRVSKYLSN